MKILFLYQDITSGSNIATENTVRAYRKLYPKDAVVVYKQRLPRLHGNFTFIYNFLWSIFDYRRILNKTSGINVIYATHYTWAIAKTLSKHRLTPAVFHIHGDQSIAPKPAGVMNIKNIYHNLIGRLVFRAQKYALQTTVANCFVSEVARDQFFIKYPFFRLQKSHIIPNGVEPELFFPVNQKTKRLLKKMYGFTEKVIILYIGRMDEKKGVHRIIGALPQIPGAGLVIVYPGISDNYENDYKTYLTDLIRQLGLNNVRFLKKPGQIAQIYQCADYLVLPSVQEMSPLVIFEAMSCGVLPIATDTGAIRETLSRLAQHLLIANPSSESIAERISILEKSGQRKKQQLIRRLTGRSKKFTWQKSAAILRETFLTVTLSI